MKCFWTYPYELIDNEEDAEEMRNLHLQRHF